MRTYFNVAENGGGSYRLLAVLRWIMVVIFVSFDMQKFTFCRQRASFSTTVHLFS